jgi:hypothetical protein
MDELNLGGDWVVGVCCEAYEAVVLQGMARSDTVGHCRAGLEAAGISREGALEVEHGVDAETPPRGAGVSWPVADLERPAGLVER